MAVVSSFQTAAQLCPHCGHLLDSCTPIGSSEGPKPGDVSICVSCATPLEFGPELRLQEANLEAYPESLQKQLRRMQQVLVQAKEEIALDTVAEL